MWSSVCIYQISKISPAKYGFDVRFLDSYIPVILLTRDIRPTVLIVSLCLYNTIENVILPCFHTAQ